MAVVVVVQTRRRRFVCEICGKGFQRDQNLQLHRRGHNLPWKLRQRSGKEPRKRVYVCPEKSCVHHNPSRALGDLTGIKKHFCRKHGEKKWKCDKCSKRYAVQSDWKAHSKTCGTREYRCDCGTLFSSHFLLSPWHAQRSRDALPPMSHIGVLANGGVAPVPPQLYADLFAPGSGAPPQFDAAQLSWLYGNGKLSSSNSSELTSATAAAAAAAKEAEDSVPSVFSNQQHAKPAAPTDMSATALLQKAAQIGAVTSTAAVPLVGAFEPTKSGATASPADAFGKFDGAAMFAASHHNANLGSAMSELTAAAGNVPYDVLSAVRHAGLKDAGVGREETRDFLGVGVQALCSSSIHGWI
uniref:C2H2-type domain-containing protein n=1 Tax=Oryza brachyantha TaxID=4533 RepID=J3KY56_ORYBR